MPKKSICLFKEFFMKKLLLESDPSLVAPWISSSFPIIRIVLFCLVVVCAIVLIIATLMQNEDSGGTDVITGQQESYYSKNKGGSRDGKLHLITVIFSCIAVVCIILYFVTLLVPGGKG